MRPAFTEQAKIRFTALPALVQNNCQQTQKIKK